MTRIGIFGGTFNPPHLGHRRAADAARISAGLDVVLWVPAGDPYHKDSCATPAETRVAWTAAAVDAAGDGHELSRASVDHPGPSRTLNTLKVLAERYDADTEFVLIVGSDTAAVLDTWFEAQQVCDRAEIAVVDRPSDPTLTGLPGGLRGRLRHITVDGPPISSTAVRHALETGAPLDGLVERSVAELLHQHTAAA